MTLRNSHNNDEQMKMKYFKPSKGASFGTICIYGVHFEVIIDKNGINYLNSLSKLLNFIQLIFLYKSGLIM